MTINPVIEKLEREEIKIVGFSVTESLNNILNHDIVKNLRESLFKRKSEINGRKTNGIYLVQLYSDDGEWTHDTPFENIVAFEVDSLSDIPNDMVQYTIPAGFYTHFIHKGPESKIGDTYESINEYSLRPFDIEYWHDISSLDDAETEIDIYIPVKS
ncbi:GyrI-like domain-containing protein [Sutcliffiella rhizosphaerae]|uniref:AraC effector-binding domain-containing protein n=1 Tax=Sutcliffiella rhizosphaerae TaxID=2880967 RepID=A0ABM8YNB1_9BACI|nr:GyrI-like domain-containing protein [Sutcliffiella rhizosphaerae]CAG9621475.1 hypothetical protein BACCIP111883_02248 [Sutcliffiella rhizosphaerae]